MNKYEYLVSNTVALDKHHTIIGHFLSYRKTSIQHAVASPYGYPINFATHNLPQPESSAELNQVLRFILGCGDCSISLTKAKAYSSDDDAISRAMKIASLLHTRENTHFSRKKLAQATLNIGIPIPDTNLILSDLLQSLYGCVWFSKFAVFRKKDTPDIAEVIKRVDSVVDLVDSFEKQKQKALDNPFTRMEAEGTLFAYEVGDAVRLLTWGIDTIRPEFTDQLDKLIADFELYCEKGVRRTVGY